MPPITKNIEGIGPVNFDSEADYQDFIQSQPAKPEQDFHHTLSEPPAQKSSAITLPDNINYLYDYAQQYNPASKEYRKYMEAFADERDNFLKLNPVSAGLTEAQQKEKNKQGTVDDIKNALGLLKNIETYPGVIAPPAQLIQSIGEKMNLNPDLTAYNQKASMLLAPIAKGVQGEVGNLSEFEQKAAKAFLPQGTGLFSEKGRNVQLQNLFDSVQARTGRDLTSEINPEELKSMGYLGKLLNQQVQKQTQEPTQPQQPQGLTPEQILMQQQMKDLMEEAKRLRQ
jgi:hypothetical protein